MPRYRCWPPPGSPAGSPRRPPSPPPPRPPPPHPPRPRIPRAAVARAATRTHLLLPNPKAVGKQAEKRTGVGYVWLTNSSSFGWTTHGLNGQLTVQNSGQTAFYLVATSTGAYYKWHVDGADTHCLTDDGGTFEVETCGQGMTNQWLTVAQPGANGTGCLISDFDHTTWDTAVYDNSNGKPVWDDNNTNGWRKWSSGIYPSC